jgi:RNA polymerase subunit RPABC4/transcription elongation factor Spt4
MELAGMNQVELSKLGQSAVELAAEQGHGPLSERGKSVWHGDARPCVSCGQLVGRDGQNCEACAQDHSPEMLRKMRAHSGPWYVLDHVRPFPGVTFERLVRQVVRGVLTPITIVRGPTTFHQWRFAGETPGLSKFLGVCWKCQQVIRPEAGQCAQCGADQDEPAALEIDEGVRPTDDGGPIDVTPDDIPAIATPTLSGNGGVSSAPDLEGDLASLAAAMRQVQVSSGGAVSVSVRRRKSGWPAGLMVALLSLLSTAIVLGMVWLRTSSADESSGVGTGGNEVVSPTTSE